MAEPEDGPESPAPPDEQAPPADDQAPPADERLPPADERLPPEGVDEEELRRRIEEQLRKVRVQDLLLESVVSIANLVARRIAKEDERDLEQARVGIDAITAVVDLLEPEPQKQVRNAISELQVLFARHARGGAPPAPEGAAAPGAQTGKQGSDGAEEAGEEGSAASEGEAPSPRRDSGLWTPPGT